MNTTGSITLINTIAQGASSSQRIGRKVMLKSLAIRGRAASDTATLTTTGAMIIIYDRRPQDALPAITDIMEAIDTNSWTNTANVGRFQILRRKQWAFAGNIATAAQSTAKSIYSIDDFIDLKGKPCNFGSAGTGAIGDITTGALYLVTVGNTVAGTADANLTVTFRTRYNDM